MSIVSYAQNFEDVMLWRALGHVNNGFYIDIGAQHPVVDSVSKAFYEKGWRGIHVEATPVYAELLRQDRPDEAVLQVALASSSGMLTFYEIPETGLSTGDAQIANRHREKGFIVRELAVPCTTLAQIFAQAGDRDIHWLKIDVEGMEQEVIASWGESESRPWIVVVESTLPNTQIETHEEWESLLLTRGYEFVYFDGLNRFYVSEKHTNFAAVFRAGPNVFDGFSLSGTGQTSFCSLINSRARQQQDNQQQIIVRLERDKVELQRQSEEFEQRLTLQVRVAEKESERLSRALAADTYSHAARERALAELVAQTGRQARSGQEDLLRALVQREQKYTQQLLEIQQQVEQEKIEQIRQLKRESDERERALAALVSQASLKVEHFQRTIVEREKISSERLVEVVEAGANEKAELGRLYRQQEHLLLAELATKERAIEEQSRIAREAAIQLEREFAEREVALSRRFDAAQEQFVLEKLEIARAFEQDKSDLIKEHLSRCDEIRRDLSSAERALASTVELYEADAERRREEALFYIDRLDKLQKFIVKNEEKESCRSESLWRKISPISLKASTVARIYNLVSTLDADIKVSPELQGIGMNSQVITQVNYQPTFEQNKSGVYDLDDFASLYDRNFVRAAYLAILRREPDPDGERHYVKQVRAGVAKDEILDDILKSKEARQYKTFIRGLKSASVVRKICRIPLFGQIFFAMLFLFDIKNHLQDLRALENHVIRIAEESHERYRDQIKKMHGSQN